jgi:transcriptional regulator with XRE-family HTH domain
VTEITETLYDRVRRLRAERGLSQRDLASPGVTAVYVCRIEKGDRHPSVVAIRRLAEKLGTTARYLETGRDPLLDGLASGGVPYETLTEQERAMLEFSTDQALYQAAQGFAFAVETLRRLEAEKGAPLADPEGIARNVCGLVGP